MIAGLLEVALDLEEGLAPFGPAIERLVREDRLSAVDAVTKLLWMDVELDPREATETAPPPLPPRQACPRG